MASSNNKYDSFLFRASWWQSMKNLPDVCRTEVYDAVCMYVFEGKEPTFDPMSATSMAVRFIITDLEYDKQKYADVSEKRAAAGRRGGQAKAANVANAKSEQQPTTDARQNVANVANAKNRSNRIEENRIDLNSIGSNRTDNIQNDSSFSFPADAEKKEKIIFEFSLILLSEGRPNAYKEATEAYNYNDATDWETEKTDKAGNVTKKKIRNKLAWMQAGWNRHNEQIFAPAHGQILANILRATGMQPENQYIINGFRGFRFDGSDATITFLYTNVAATRKFGEAIGKSDKVNKTVFGELLKEFPNVKELNFKTY